jgi:hypothetical protein
MTRMTRKDARFWVRKADDERKWLETHGGCLSAYVERYGAATDPEKYGDGGEAIYAADKNAVAHAEAQAATARKVLGLML